MDKKIEKKFWNTKRSGWIAGSTVLVSVLVFELAFADKRNKLNVDKEKIT